MCRPPDGKGRDAEDRSDVHVGRIHRNHHVELRHEQHLVFQSTHLPTDVDNSTFQPFCLLFPSCQDFPLLLASSEEEHLASFICQFVHHLLHLVQRIYLLCMSSKGCHTHPFLAFLLFADMISHCDEILVSQVNLHGLN